MCTYKVGIKCCPHQKKKEGDEKNFIFWLGEQQRRICVVQRSWKKKVTSEKNQSLRTAWMWVLNVHFLCGILLLKYTNFKWNMKIKTYSGISKPLGKSKDICETYDTRNSSRKSKRKWPKNKPTTKPVGYEYTWNNSPALYVEINHP